MAARKLFGSVKASLLTLAMGGIAVGMTEFMMMGVLPDLAKSLGISIPAAGHLISIYALGVVVGAPLMTVFTARFRPKIVLIALMGMFTLFNLLFAVAPDYALLLVARFFAGLPHGAFFGMGAVVASRLATPGREARAVSIMFAGLTVANIIGVPIGTWIGHHLNWRLSFVLIAAIAFLAAAAIKKWLPDLAPQAKTSATEALKVFGQADIWLIIGIASIGTGGLFAWISYIAPMMTAVAGIDPNHITAVMIIAGLGMAAGNLAGGRLADHFSPLKTTSAILLAMVLSLLVVALLAQWPVPAIGMTFITGAIAFAVIAPLQMLMIRAAKGSETLASAALQASANMGNALGAWLGGVPIAAGYSYTAPEYVGAGLALTGVLLCLVLRWRSRSSLRKTFRPGEVFSRLSAFTNLLNGNTKKSTHENSFH